jgi:hypothetical protein
MLLSDYITQVRFLVHDQASSDFTDSEITAAVNNARTVVAEDFNCCRVTYLAQPTNAPNPAAYNPVNVIPNQELYPLIGVNGQNGIVVGANVTNGGSGYSDATTVTFQAGPAGSVTATGVPVITNGVVTGINMTAWGTGYNPALPSTQPGSVQPPTVTIADSGGGVGATAIATMFNNVFNVIQISYLWGNQRYALTWKGTMLFQAYMRSQLFFTQRGMVWTINNQQGYVQIQPPPDQNYVTEWDTICLPIPLLNPGDADLQILPVYAEPVQYYAAHLCLLKLQNFEQAEFMLKLYSARVPKTIISTGGVRIPNPYNKNFQRRVSR